MAFSPIVLRVFEDVRHHMGIEQECYAFKHLPPPLNRVDVLVHRYSTTPAVTVLSTAGMSSVAMPGAHPAGFGGLAELRHIRRGRLSSEEEYAIAARLSEIAGYPWKFGKQLNWGHIVELSTDFPGSPGCPAAFLSAPFNVDTQDCMWIDELTVRILYVIPITDVERAKAIRMKPGDFLCELISQVDLFAPRRGFGTRERDD